MKQIVFIGILLAILILGFAPVSGAVAPQAGNATSTLQASSDQPFISASVSPNPATEGVPVTVSGVATGGNLTAGVQIWVFAGNYVNVSTTPVNADGSYAKTYQTAGLPPAIYYVIVQSPGNDGDLGFVMETSGQYSGQVVNAKTGMRIFNFTGMGSVQDSAAATALSDAFNLPGVDDVYTKCTFTLVAPETAAPVSTTSAPVATPTTKKSPVPVIITLFGLGVAGIALVQHSRK